LPMYKEPNMTLYYDRLQQISDVARFLQGQPVPDDQGTLSLMDALIDNANHGLQCVAGVVCPEVWVGATDDPLRGGRPMAPGL
jgi:hypothetical protein